MDFPSLIKELGDKLGASLSLSEHDTCSVLFDEDEVVFELRDGRLFMTIDIGSADGRDEDYPRFLAHAAAAANTGFSCLGIDPERNVFTLTHILEGDMDESGFEQTVTIFVCAARHWMDYLVTRPREGVADKPFDMQGLPDILIRI